MFSGGCQAGCVRLDMMTLADVREAEKCRLGRFCTFRFSITLAMVITSSNWFYLEMLHHKFMMTISTLLKSKIWTLHAKTKFLNDGKQRQLYFNVNMQDFIDIEHGIHCFGRLCQFPFVLGTWYNWTLIMNVCTLQYPFTTATATHHNINICREQS